jgi:hypothetical protein
MIKIENVSVSGWEAAIRGMRNPMNSWDRSDSYFDSETGSYISKDGYIITTNKDRTYRVFRYYLGEEDRKLMHKLAKAGNEHAKFRRMLNVTMDITAPLYFWKEFDTYKVGTVSNSCSTMHKIHSKEFTLDDFSVEHLYTNNLEAFGTIISALNESREVYLKTKEKEDWWQMIQLLPSSYNQRRTVQLNYEVLNHIYHQRKNHKLDEWREFCDYILKTLPYSEELIEVSNE